MESCVNGTNLHSSTSSDSDPLSELSWTLTNFNNSVFIFFSFSALLSSLFRDFQVQSIYMPFFPTLT